MIWLLRPGPPGVEGTGGLASRQPRAAWLVALTLVALVGFVWWAVRRQRRVARQADHRARSPGG